MEVTNVWSERRCSHPGVASLWFENLIQLQGSKSDVLVILDCHAIYKIPKLFYNHYKGP